MQTTITTTTTMQLRQPQALQTSWPRHDRDRTLTEHSAGWGGLARLEPLEFSWLVGQRRLKWVEHALSLSNTAAFDDCATNAAQFESHCMAHCLSAGATCAMAALIANAAAASAALVAPAPLSTHVTNVRATPSTKNCQSKCKIAIPNRLPQSSNSNSNSNCNSDRVSAR